VLDALRRLQGLYAHEQRQLPVGTQVFLGRVWQEALTGADRERAFCAFEVATLIALRRALRNGTVWIDHSLAFRSRERLFIPPDRWLRSAAPISVAWGSPLILLCFLNPLWSVPRSGWRQWPTPRRPARYASMTSYTSRRSPRRRRTRRYRSCAPLLIGGSVKRSCPS
jgi:hypothetical protein